MAVEDFRVVDVGGNPFSDLRSATAWRSEKGAGAPTCAPPPTPSPADDGRLPERAAGAARPPPRLVVCGKEGGERIRLHDFALHFSAEANRRHVDSPADGARRGCGTRIGGAELRLADEEEVRAFRRLRREENTSAHYALNPADLLPPRASLHGERRFLRSTPARV